MTTNEIAVQQHSAEIVPGPAALGRLMEQADAMSAALKLGSAIAGTDLAPKDYKGKPENAAIAILYGAELGLSAIQSVQQIFVVQGRPAIYARTMVALVMRHGYRVRTESSTDESVTVVGTAPDGTTETSTWTFERAKKAGYTTNKKYETDPQAMLYAKATSEVCRKLAPDVLLGIPHSREELELEPAPVRVESQRVTAADLIGEPAAVAPTPTESGSKVGDEAKPARAERKVTKDQLTRLWTLMSKLHMSDKESSLAWISDIVKRPEGDDLKSTKDLTTSEIQKVFAELEEAIAAEESAPSAEPEQGTLTAEAGQ